MCGLDFVFFFIQTDMSEGNGRGTADLDHGNRGISMVYVSSHNQGLHHVQPVLQANHHHHSPLIQSPGNLQAIQVVRVNTLSIFSLMSGMVWYVL